MDIMWNVISADLPVLKEKSQSGLASEFKDEM